MLLIIKMQHISFHWLVDVNVLPIDGHRPLMKGNVATRWHILLNWTVIPSCEGICRLKTYRRLVIVLVAANAAVMACRAIYTFM